MRKSRKGLMIDYQSVFGSEAGKAVLADLELLAPMMRGTIKPTDSLDTNRTFLLLGRSDVLKHIYMMMNKDPYSEREEQATNQGE